MKYCDLHTPDSLQDEEGDGCPLCESMIDKNERLTRWAATNKHQKAQLAAQAALLDDCLKVMRNVATGYAGKKYQERLETKAAALVKRLEAYKEVDDE